MALDIEAWGLVKRYGGDIALAGIDLAVEAGTVFALLGPNGAGKTTTINILTTLVQPDAGSARVAGQDVVHDRDEVKRRLSLTGQSVAVDGMLTGRENLLMLGQLLGLGRLAARRRAAELLADFGLAEAGGRRVSTYSGGMRRRLDLALSLIQAPQVLFLDEPTTGLDTRSRQELWALIRGLAETGTTVFLTTQYLEEADLLADRIAVLDAGRIAARGTADELKAQVGGETVELRDADGALLASVSTDGTVHGLRQAIDSLDAAGLTGTVGLRRPTLDDVFLAVTDPTTLKGAA